MTIPGRTKVQPDAVDAYKSEGPGIGAGAGVIDWVDKNTAFVWTAGQHCLEIGCGQGEFVANLAAKGLQVTALDIAEASIEETWNKVRAKGGIDPARVSAHCMDVSHQPLPLSDDVVDIAACTETIEHLSNPYYMFAETKRVLKHGGFFVLAFPMPEDNLGYGGGMHAHVYPGFLTKESFERFCMQMYFKLVTRKQNGSSAWYFLRNYKGEGMVDPFAMIAGNYTEEQLYGCMKEF